MLMRAGSGLWSVCGAVIEAVGLPALFEGIMAVPSGSKPNKNGRKVYSQTANAIRKRKQLGLGEFADAAAADIPASTPAVETPLESVSAPGGFSNEAIGVTSTVTVLEEPLAPHIEDAPNYFCMNCKGTVSLMDTECDTCEEPLDWSGLT
jgi:hypothetical protein